MGNKVSETVSGLGFLTSIIITFIFQLILLISLIKQRCNASDKTNGKYEFIVYGIYTSMICYTISIVAFTSITKDAFQHEKYSFASWVLLSIANSSLIAGGLLMYLSLVYRLYETFNGTIYALPKYKVYIHIIMATIFILLFIMVYSIPSLAIYSYNIICGYYLVMMLGAMHLVYAFNHNLFLLVLQQRSTTTSEQIELSPMQLNMLLTLRKHTLLGCILIFFDSCSGSLGILANKYLFPWLRNHDTDSMPSEIWIWLMFYIIAVTSCFNISSLCIYLGFTVNRRWYIRLCKFGDRICEKLCIQCTQRIMNKPNDYILWVEDGL